MSSKATKSCSENRNNENSLKNNKTINILVISLVVLLISQIGYLINLKISTVKSDFAIQNEVSDKNSIKTLRYWRVNVVKWNPKGSLQTMDRVFKSLQYKFVNASLDDDWDILWSIEHPFASTHENDTLFADISKRTLRPEQKVNHFPGISSLVSKSYMNRLNSHLDYILPSFVLPNDEEEFKSFIETNPNVTFVEKNYYNRGVKVVNVTAISYNKSEVFYQKFMDKPFLIDGHAFDIGVYVLITSFDPIRIYRYGADMLLRFCAAKYYPFDPRNRSKYVVKEGSHPPNVLPTFKDAYRRYKYPFKKIFEYHIEQKGFDVKEVWKDIDEAIVLTILNSEFSVIERLHERNVSSQHFFELVRYDFMFDENMKLHLMEVNMSPNLTPTTKKHREYILIYEQLIFNVLKMIGGGSYFEFMSRFNKSDITIAGSKNIAVDIDSCIKNECHQNCSKTECKICQPCINSHNRYQMREAFREHLYEANFKRIFPVLSQFEDKDLYEWMTPNNKISNDWFKAKCRDDEKWC